MDYLDIATRAFGWALKSFRRRVVVKRMVPPYGPNFVDTAFHFYTRRVSDNQRDSFENIVRWQQEYARRKEKAIEMVGLSAGRRNLGASLRPPLRGNTSVHTRLLFVAHAVSDDKAKQPCRVVPAFVKHFSRLLRAELRECVGLVFELEHPDFSDKPKKCWHREDYFRSVLRDQGFDVKRLAIDYRQPRLSLRECHYKEEPRLLIYGRVRPPPVGTTLSKEEVARVLDAVYNDWYGDSYEDDATRDTEYRAYLRQMYNDAITALPNQVSVA